MTDSEDQASPTGEGQSQPAAAYVPREVPPPPPLPAAAYTPGSATYRAACAASRRCSPVCCR